MNTWKQATYWGISTQGNPDDSDAAFNAGRINDVLRLNEFPVTTLLAAGDTSGVWLINTAGGIALPLGDRWKQPNLSSLAHGVHGSRHIYAGGDILHETDTTKSAPLFNWRDLPVVDASGNNLNAGYIWDIAVLPDLQKIVLACDNGVFWANIPAPGGTYAFKAAALALPGRYSGVAAGAGGTGVFAPVQGPQVVAAAWGIEGDVNHFGIFTGIWSGSNLNFMRASILGSVKPSMMLRTSVASCPLNRFVMYAVAGTYYRDAAGNVTNDTIYRVLKSVDGGTTWKPTGAKVANASDPLFGDPSKNLPGNQQDYNNCIDVSGDPNVVVVGWRGGYFTSTNGGKDWTMVREDGNPHLHEDLHGVTFDQFDGGHKTIYIASDGGLAITPDLGASHSSVSNRQLANLQIYRLGASYQNSGVLAVSTQDNGDDFTSLYPTANPWTDRDGGDGISVTFLRTGQLVYRNNTMTLSGVEFGNRVRAGRWNTTTRLFEDEKLFPNPPLSWGVIPLDGVTDGLTSAAIEIVNNPLFSNAQGELMIAVAGLNNLIFGLFRKSSGALHWTQLYTIPLNTDASANLTEHIIAIGSGDGKEIFAGTDAGRIVKVKTAVFSITDMRLAPGAVTRFVIQDPALAFATAAGQQLLKLSGGAWAPIAGPAGASGDYTAIETDWTVSPKTLFLSTDNRVYASQDNGATWAGISTGLPETPHCTDLRFVTEKSGVHFLYLATYGRSVFRVRLNGDDQRRVVNIDGKMDMVDRVAFGHDLWAHPTFSNLAILSADHPEEEILIVEDDGDEVQVKLKIHLQWFIDNSVEAQFTAQLISKDEDNEVEDTATGSFTIPAGGSHTFVADLESDELWPDRAHIEFTVKN